MLAVATVALAGLQRLDRLHLHYGGAEERQESQDHAFHWTSAIMGARAHWAIAFPGHRPARNDQNGRRCAGGPHRAECILFAGFSVAMCFDTRQLRDQIKRLNAEAPFALGSLTRRQTCSSDPVWRSKKCASYPNSRTSSSVCRPILRLRETGLPLALDWRNLESAGWRRVPPLSSDRFDRLTASARGGSREANNS